MADDLRGADSLKSAPRFDHGLCQSAEFLTPDARDEHPV
jgi:hypothetical protein